MVEQFGFIIYMAIYLDVYPTYLQEIIANLYTQSIIKV